jgi:hypothetical protein
MQEIAQVEAGPCVILTKEGSLSDSERGSFRTTTASRRDASFLSMTMYADRSAPAFQSRSGVDPQVRQAPEKTVPVRVEVVDAGVVAGAGDAEPDRSDRLLVPDDLGLLNQ